MHATESAARDSLVNPASGVKCQLVLGRRQLGSVTLVDSRIDALQTANMLKLRQSDSSAFRSFDQCARHDCVQVTTDDRRLPF